MATQDNHEAAVRLGAQLHHQAVTYTDARIAELKADLQHVRDSQERIETRTMKQRLVLHGLFIAFGTSLSIALLLMSVAPVMAVIVTGGPSVLTEVVDYFRKF